MSNVISVKFPQKRVTDIEDQDFERSRIRLLEEEISYKDTLLRIFAEELADATRQLFEAGLLDADSEV